MECLCTIYDHSPSSKNQSRHGLALAPDRIGRINRGANVPLYFTVKPVGALFPPFREVGRRPVGVHRSLVLVNLIKVDGVIIIAILQHVKT